MPLPFIAAASVAAVVGATHDCEPGNEVDDDIAETNESVSPSSSSDQKNDESLRRKVDFVDENNDEMQFGSSNQPPQKPSDIFSQRRFSVGRQHHESTSFYRDATGSIHLGRVTPTSPINVESDVGRKRGYLHGHFGSGITHQVQFPSSTCSVAHYNPSGDLLAVGITDAIVFYETHSYQEASRIPIEGRVVALQWHRYSASSDCLAVGTQTGHVYVFAIRPTLIEIEGCQTIYQGRLRTAVCAVDVNLVGKLEPTLLLAVSDENGALHLLSIDCDNNDRLISHDTMECSKSSILSVAIQDSMLAYATANGETVVGMLKRKGDKAIGMSEILYRGRTNGAVRCITFGTDYIAFGGYGKTVQLVETKMWSPLRVLSLGGTVCASTNLSLRVDHYQLQYQQLPLTHFSTD